MQVTVIASAGGSRPRRVTMTERTLIVLPDSENAARRDYTAGQQLAAQRVQVAARA